MPPLERGRLPLASSAVSDGAERRASLPDFLSGFLANGTPAPRHGLRSPGVQGVGRLFLESGIGRAITPTAPATGADGEPLPMVRLWNVVLVLAVCRSACGGHSAQILEFQLRGAVTAGTRVRLAIPSVSRKAGRTGVNALSFFIVRALRETRSGGSGALTDNSKTYA